MICQNLSGCTIHTELSCNSNQRSAEFIKDCNGELVIVSSNIITCPVTCPGCPTPVGQKPCRRAVWNMTYCKWNSDPCYVAECNLEFSTNNYSDYTPDESNIMPDPYCCSDLEVAMCIQRGGTWDFPSCTCISPIVIDVAGNGFHLTNAQNGVLFDITNSGVAKQISWTSANSDDAWLALDRNGNGAIDSGRELFGSATPQPAPLEGEMKNGFRALAVFDRLDRGGNNDGQIDHRDTVFGQLKLWQDTNHNGISEASELRGIAELGLSIIELDYKQSKRQDEHGNWFGFRAKVKDAQGAQIGRWAWDVFLTVSE